MHGWNIVRTRPVGTTFGRAIPAFINNWGYHLDTVDVYADGAIDCWGFLDRALFAKKLISGWVMTAPPIGRSISMFNLGSAGVAAAEWLLSPEDLYDIVDAAIRELNPEMANLVDMHGDDTELRGKSRYAKLGLADEKPFRRTDSGAEVLASALPVIVSAGDELRHSHWFVYADGLTQFGYHGELLPFDEAASLLRDGTVTTSAADGSWISIGSLGRFKVEDGEWGIDPSERIREARDELAILQGEAGTRERCLAAYEAYEQDPSEANRTLLRSAYEAVPTHLRIFCGDMDSQDWPIRRILYGDEKPY